MEQAYEEILLEVMGAEIVKSGYPFSSSRTFSLRQADYLARKSRQMLNEELIAQLKDILPDHPRLTKQQMLCFYLRKVVAIARSHTHHGLSLLELVNEGISGLILAARKFEREGGFRFSSYATQHIRHSMECAIGNMEAGPDCFRPASTGMH